MLVPEHPNEIILQDQIDYVSRVQNANKDAFLRSEIDRFARSQEEARRRQNFLSGLDKIHELRGSGVIFYGQYGNSVVIRNPQGSQHKTVIIRETPKIIENDPIDDRFASELAGTVLSCSAAVFGSIAIFGGSVLMPFSGGTTAVLVFLGRAATVASGSQCISGIYRTIKIKQGDTSTVDWLDSQEWYLYMTLSLDAISVAGGAAAMTTSIKTALALKKAAPTKSIFEILKSMGRQERKRLSEDMVRLNLPGISNKALKAMVRSGSIPKRFSQVQITQSMRTQIIDLFGAGASMIGSGLNGIINKTGTSVSIILLEGIAE
ncbi:MAG: hypothetical protein L0Z73_14605 [Gammaproteobacteria bacterium]|nr:hypothetical protein [Gammaproteobacteria bacterium]